MTDMSPVTMLWILLQSSFSNHWQLKGCTGLRLPMDQNTLAVTRAVKAPHLGQGYARVFGLGIFRSNTEWVWFWH